MHIKTLCRLLLAASLAFLAACATPPSSPIAGPGPQSATAGEASGLFQAVCVANQNNLRAAPATLSGLPFTYNSSNQLYFHNTLDLSFLLIENSNGSTTCSMVWSSSQSDSANQAAISRAAPRAVFDARDNTRLLRAQLLGSR